MKHPDLQDFAKIFLGISPPEIEAGMQKGMASRLAEALLKSAHKEAHIGDGTNSRFLKYFEHVAHFFSHLEHDPSVMIPLISGMSYEHPSYPRHMGVICRNMVQYFRRSIEINRTFDADHAFKVGPYEQVARTMRFINFSLSKTVPKNG